MSAEASLIIFTTASVLFSRFFSSSPSMFQEIMVRLVGAWVVNIPDFKAESRLGGFSSVSGLARVDLAASLFSHLAAK